jgi:UDP-N-acetylmuramoylalanine--D-glutamate ligase
LDIVFPVVGRGYFFDYFVTMNKFNNFVKSLKGKKVVVWGLGLNQGGLGAALFFAKAGAQVLVVDFKSADELKNSVKVLRRFSNVKFSLGNQDEKNFVNAGLVIKNQAIPWDNPLVKKLLKKRVSVELDITLFFKFFKGKVVGITGSKGKTTTTILTGQLLKKAGKKVVVGGNLQVSLFDFFTPRILEDKKMIAVLELSSFQLEDLAKIKMSPQVAVVTNILRDHLNRYGSYAKYVAAKKIICRFQGKKDYLILNAQDKKLKGFGKNCKGRVVWYSLEGSSNEILRSSNNQSNLAAALALAKIFKVKKNTIDAVVKNFKGVPYRMEKIRTLKNVTFINDTTATIPDAAVNNLKTFSQKVILIGGGSDKNLKFKSFAGVIAKKVKKLILLPGNATPFIVGELKKAAPNLERIEVGSMDKAVKTAYKAASAGDVVLLSPGATSFGLFKNEFDRGDQFNAAVRKLK